MELELDEYDRQATAVGRDLDPEEIDSAAGKGLGALSNDETERLIALCEAPALLWYGEPGAPEPFGLIA